MRVVFDKILKACVVSTSIDPHFSRQYIPSPASGPELERVGFIVRLLLPFGGSKLETKWHGYCEVPVFSSTCTVDDICHSEEWKSSVELCKRELCELVQDHLDSLLPYM